MNKTKEPKIPGLISVDMIVQGVRVLTILYPDGKVVC